jgi:hypothetical protein
MRFCPNGWPPGTSLVAVNHYFQLPQAFSKAEVPEMLITAIGVFMVDSGGWCI